MAMTAQQIADQALQLLQDTSGVRWPAATTVLGWINAGIRELVRLQPEAGMVTADLTLVEGARQTITGAAIQKFVDQSPVLVSLLDGALPGWKAAVPGTTVQYVAFDPATPREFWVYPPQAQGTTATVTITQLVVPAALTALANNLPVHDIYGEPLVDYVCYRCLQSETGADAQNQSLSYWNAFAGKLGAKQTAPPEPGR